MPQVLRIATKGQHVKITHGALKDLIGILSARQKNKWLIELKAGLYLFIDPSLCEALTDLPQLARERRGS